MFLSIHQFDNRNHRHGPPLRGGIASQTLDASAIRASATSVEQGCGVHFSVSETAMVGVADAAGISVWELRREAEYYWKFSVSADEDYPFAVLSDDMVCPRTAGTAAGAYVAHVFETAGRHTATLLLWHPRAGLHIGSIDITVTARDDSLRTVGVLIADASDYTVETGLTADFTYADLDAALTALAAGIIDTLLLERGKSYAVNNVNYTIGSGTVIDAFGSGAKPVIAPNFGTLGIRNFAGAVLATTGDGTTKSFTAPGSDFVNDDFGSGGLAVYVADAKLTAGVDYTFATTTTENDTISFTTAPASGVEILAARSGAGGALTAFTNVVLRVVNADTVRIRNVRFVGPYNPAAPGTFDPADLSSFEHAIHTAAIGSFNNTAGSDASSNLFIHGVEVAGLKGGFMVLSTERANFMVLNDCHFTDWFDYGAYISGWQRACVVGCSIQQNIRALNGPGKKSFNEPGVTNHADHGPIRCPLSVEMVINRCRMDSRNSWPMETLGGIEAQPIARLATSGIRFQSYAFSENHCTGAPKLFGAGVPNPSETQGPVGLIHAQGNFGILTDAVTTMTGTFSSINNIWVHAPVGGANVSTFGYTETGYVVAPDVRTDPRYSRNDTIILPDWVDRSSFEFCAFGPSVMTTPGLHNLVSRNASNTANDMHIVTADGPTVTVPVRMLVQDYLGRANNEYRIWRSPTGNQADAVAAASLSEQAAIYSFTPNSADPYSATEVEVTLLSGTFSVGEGIGITREEPWDALSEPLPDGTMGVVNNQGRFPLNNLATRLATQPAVVENLMLVIDGTMGAYRLREGDAAITDITPYRSATHQHGPLSIWGQPEVGSSGIAVSGSAASLRDFFGQDRGSDTDIGAIEAATDASALRAALPKAPVISLAFNAAITTISTGTTLTEADIELTISDAGGPVLTATDINLYFEVTPNGASEPSALVLAADGIIVNGGDMVRPVAAYTHIIAGYQRVDGTPRTVAAADFAPALFNNDDGAGNFAVIATPQGFTPWTGTTHFALRWRPNGGAGRLWETGGISYRSWGAGIQELVYMGTKYTKLHAPNALADLVIGKDYSFLLSVYPGGATTADATRGWNIGDNLRYAVHDGTNWHYWSRVHAGTPSITPTSFAGNGTTQPHRVSVWQYVAVWTGGEPNETAFFDADGSLQQWSALPDRGVPGMRAEILLDGLLQFNDPACGALPTGAVLTTYNAFVV